MSFQDVGRPGAGTAAKNRATNAAGGALGGRTLSAISEGSGDNGMSLSVRSSQISDSILQYQKNVGILEKIGNQFGTKADGPVVETQFRVQVDVIKELGERIEGQFKAQQQALLEKAATGQQHDAHKTRATHIKLMKDFRRVEQRFKNLVLDVKRKRNEARQAENQQRQQQHITSNSEKEAQMQIQLQLQQERLSEEILREREEEIRNINKGMHTVNEIYKDLAHLVDTQQEGIDQIENDMDNANETAKSGLEQIQKANNRSSQQCVIS